MVLNVSAYPTSVGGLLQGEILWFTILLLDLLVVQMGSGISQLPFRNPQVLVATAAPPSL